MKKNDVVKILHPQCLGETGVVNKVDHNMVSVFRTQKNGFATWFFKTDLKKIGGKGGPKEYDPTPYCNACKAKTEKYCKCGPIADNE